MTTSTLSFESRDKILLVMSWTKTVTSLRHDVLKATKSRVSRLDFFFFLAVITEQNNLDVNIRNSSFTNV